ncbi:hypothetical protein ACTNEW_01070 [Blautia sp. HCP3S3_G3]|uniref:hypothetical protein n=1 Tax=Blautia sp. HCP3S3_G3 TaxID=3438913 RepID=UPI003F8AF1B2
MEELVSVMMLVLEELREINTKLDDIKGIGVYGSINDLHDQLTEIDQSIDTLGDKIDGIRGSGVYDTISDVCDKLDNVENAVSSVETTVLMK